MVGFDDRCRLHDWWLVQVDSYEKSQGLKVDGTRAVENSLGQETHKALLSLPNDQISKMLRWFPDRLIVSPYFAALQELKTRRNDNTRNYAIEVDSYNAGIWLNNRGKRVFIILCPADKSIPVNELKTVWINDIKFCTGVLTQHHGSGSGTSYRLINETLSTIRPLSQFISEELLHNVKPSQRTLFEKGKKKYNCP